MKGVWKKINKKVSPGRLFYPPEWIVLGVNNACNLHCKMCDVGLGNSDTVFGRNLTGTRPMNMPLEMVKSIVDQLARSWSSTRLGFAFTEPLIWPGLVEAVAYAEDRGIGTAVTTNGLTLDTLAEPLSDAGLKDLYLSIDGTADIHDHIRGRKGAFGRAINGVKQMLGRTNRPRISIFCVITPWNIDNLEPFLKEMAGLPLETVGFMHTNFTTQKVADTHNALWGKAYPATPSNIGPFDPADIDLKKLQKAISDLKAFSAPFDISFSPELETLDQLERFYNQPDVLIGSSCIDIDRTLMVKSDGRVIPCHGRCYDLTIGNVTEQTLTEIWNAEAIADLRLALRSSGGLLPACSRCCSAF
ncbi:MAG: hypothetical protein DRJ65_23020 [Acidobacteria bacterium]|nr:MAG: hypothetical protein DRJ65_23020 [Acidobacteriota bacterium]